ncbi:hypothetical protein B0O99DRAFT_120472 [Bisporella sp. PMI_857]|nr:hypothetical protein B0O99DRAFT_120472 [Bisporella sp. PMI_857]
MLQLNSTSLQASLARESHGRRAKPSEVKKDKRCKYCDAAFSKTEHLSRHERSHTKEKPFRCTICNKVYIRRDTLLRHYKTHGNAVPPSQGDGAWLLTTHENTPNLNLNNHSSNNNASQVPRASLGSNISLLEYCESEATISANSSAVQNRYEMEPQSFPNNASKIAPGINLDPTGPLMSQAKSQPGGIGNMEPAAMLNFNEALTVPYSIWAPSCMSPGSSWLNDYDFDLQALNTSVSATIDVQEPLFQPQPLIASRASDTYVEECLDHVAQQRRKLANDDVRRGWFSHFDRPDGEDNSALTTGNLTPATGAIRTDIGDNFRHRITQRLRTHMIDEPLPPTNFLNLSVQVYFSKFSPLFPVIHSQTFRPTSENSLLLLSITSIGSLLLGSKSAAAQGTRVFERLNKAILASWEKLVYDPAEARSMIQAALIGQTFGFLSGVPKHLVIVQAFHGTIIAWARKCGMFKSQENHPELEDLTGTDLEDAWKSWARSEEVIRTVIGLYIHDAKLACMFHHEKLLRHVLAQIPVAADDDLFNAPTAIKWKEQMLIRSASRLPIREVLHTSNDLGSLSQKDPRLKTNYYTAYFALYTLAATINEQQQLNQVCPGSLNRVTYVDALINWHHTFQDEGTLNGLGNNSWSDPLCLPGLWHTVFMSLFANFDLLERAIGRDVAEDAALESAHTAAVEWANSKESERCILHAQALLRAIGAMRFDSEPAIHIPHCLFLAGIASYCFKRFRRLSPVIPVQDSARNGDNDGSAVQPDHRTDFSEITSQGTTVMQHLFGASEPTSSVMCTPPETDITNDSNSPYKCNAPYEIKPNVAAGMIHKVIDVLQRIGHWGVAQRYANTLSILAYADGTDDIYLPDSITHEA